VNLNNLDFNKLLIFSKVVEAGNYRLASEVLNVTPSALSQTITSLEHSLGIPLFHRFGKRLVLTETGEKIQREFQSHHRSLLQVFGRIANKDAQVSGLIHVGAYLEFAKFQLAPVLTAFQKKHPDVQVKLVFDTPSRLHKMLEENKLDICFSIYPERDSKLIQSKPIYREELLLVAPQGMLSERASFEEIIVSPMVEYYFNHQPIRRWLTLHFKKKPKDIPIRTFGASAEMVLALIQEGLGVGMVPEYLLQSKLLKAVTVCRPTSRKLMDNIWMLHLKGRAKSVALAAFLEEVQKAFQSSVLLVMT
jgi:DNA-binding transcriptional LysR family regulator